MARPKLSDQKNASERIALRITRELRQAIDQQAEAAGLTLTDQVCVLIEEALAARNSGQSRPRSDPTRTLAPMLQRFVAAGQAAQTAAQDIIDSATPVRIPVPRHPKERME
jgi:hypothetical protein